MAPAKSPSPIVASLRVSNKSPVYGCPGVPRSIPRIETTLEIRSSNGAPFRIKSVGIELRTTQKLVMLSALGSNETTRDFVIYENPNMFRPGSGTTSEQLLGLDVPVLIPIPKDITASGYFPIWNTTTIHNVGTKVVCLDVANTEATFVEAFPIAIKLYDNLPLYRKFNEPLIEKQHSKDDQVALEVITQLNSIGPRDSIPLTVKTMINAHKSKIKKGIKLKFINLQLLEILECYEGSTRSRKEHKLISETKSFLGDDAHLTSQESVHSFNLTLPLENDILLLYCPMDEVNKITSQVRHLKSDSLSPHAFSDTVNELPPQKSIEGIPISHSKGFSSTGKLFAILHEVNVKEKLVNARDIEIRFPITVCPFNKESSSYLLNWIVKECDVARHKFGRELVSRSSQLRYDEMVKIIRRFNPPAISYRYTKADWVRLGYNTEAFGRNRSIKPLISYID